MDDTHSGACLCGVVRYTVQGPLRPVVVCHCTQCRRQTGHYLAATSVP
ncbi:MAG: GFA family protein, partial [Gammaproteobacteria bacterium]